LLQPWQSELQRQGVLRQLVAINDHDIVSVSFSGFLQIIGIIVFFPWCSLLLCNDAVLRAPAFWWQIIQGFVRSSKP
jgi:hypothetical protein